MTTCRLNLGEVLKASEMGMLIYADKDSATRKPVLGLTGLKLPTGYNRGSAGVAPAGGFAYDVPTMPKMQPITAKLLWQFRDKVHKEIENRGWCQNDYNQDFWFLARNSEADHTKDIIFIPNHVDYPFGGVSVQNFNIGEQTAENGIYMADVTFLSNLQHITTFIQLFDTSTPDFKFTTTTITRTTGSFVDDGIEPDMKIYIDDEAALIPNFRKIVTVDTVVPLTITVKEAGYLVLDATGSATTVLRAGLQ